MTIDYGIAALAFSAGMASFFSPCAAAMLPAYASLYIGKGSAYEGVYRRASRGLFFGLVATLGFILFFVSAGTLVSLLGSRIAALFPYFSIAIGAALLLAGASMFAGKSLAVSLPFTSLFSVSPQAEMTPRWVFGYGLTYASTSLGCTLPIFLAVLAASFVSGGLVNAALTFSLYGLGKGLLMTLFTTSLAISKEAMTRRLRDWAPRMRTVNALVLMFAGLYLLYVYVYLIPPPAVL